MNSSLDEPDGDGHRSATAPAPPAPDPASAVSSAVAAEFTAFYRTAAPRLVAFLRWQGASLPDAADCAQEALAQAFRQWSTLRHPRAWCRLVASRLYARQVAAIREDPSGDLDRAAGAPLLAPDTDVAELESRHTVLALLEHLPPRQRQVMAWTYDDATPTEIAAALQITSDALRSNLHKARDARAGQLARGRHQRQRRPGLRE